MKAVLELRNVSMVLPASAGAGEVSVLEKVNLDCSAAEFVVVMGASGSGKTTLLNLIAGHLQPTSGHIKWHGRPIVEYQSTHAVIVQKHMLLPQLSVLENVVYSLLQQGVSQAERIMMAEQTIELLGLQDRRDQRIYQLSATLQQRVGLARALMLKPDILLMDEPFATSVGHDREALQKLLIEVWHKTKTMVFFITHNVEEALFIATKLIVMSPRPGRILQTVELDFSKQYLALGDAREIKTAADFRQRREAVLAILDLVGQFG